MRAILDETVLHDFFLYGYGSVMLDLFLLKMYILLYEKKLSSYDLLLPTRIKGLSNRFERFGNTAARLGSGRYFNV